MSIVPLPAARLTRLREVRARATEDDACGALAQRVLVIARLGTVSCDLPRGHDGHHLARLRRGSLAYRW